jgi:hypothetical protein
MPRQYIADIIPSSEINKWKPGDRILITSQTGSGKSQWVKDQLYNYCEDSGKKILLLSNRSILRDQNKTEIEAENKQDIITLRNYQSLEKMIEEHEYTVENVFNNFDFIVYDEVHYVFSDSSFNPNTDILMKPILYSLENKILIFITATPQTLRFYSPKYDYEYTIKTDYSYIENLYFYSKSETIDNILRTIPTEKKVIYFGGAKESFELSERFDNSAFLCSDGNDVYSRKSSKKVRDQIINTSRFDKQFLFSTKVLDNGINVILPELKYIFIDMTDPTDILQCLGRKRIVNDKDKINLYIKDRHGNQIVPMLRNMRIKLDLVNEQKRIGIDAFLNKYARKHLNNIFMTNGQVNDAKLIHTKYMIDIFSKMLGNKDKKGFQLYVSKLLLQDMNNIKDAEMSYERQGIESVLRSYLGKKLYKEDIEQFKNIFFQNIFAPKRKIDIRKRGQLCINSILEEDNIHYHISSKVDSTADRRNQTYWIVIDDNSTTPWE